MKFLDDIEQRASKATRGPWSGGLKYTDAKCVVAVAGPYLIVERSAEAQANSEFANHARTDIPKLCEALRKAVEMAEFVATHPGMRFKTYEIAKDAQDKAREFLAWLENQ